MTAARLAADLAAARTRSLGLLDPFDDEVLNRQHHPLMSPLVWDLAHVANYEDLWLLRALGRPAGRPEIDHLYDAFRQPRAVRAALPLLDPVAARSYGAEVRARALEGLATDDLAGDGPDPLRRHGYVYAMVVQHEQQHAETLLAAISLLPGDDVVDPPAAPADGPLVVASPRPDEVLVPAGPFRMGSDDPWAYDNERPTHEVDLPAYRIDAAPVTNARYLAFVEDGGYHDRRWWTDEGWRWRVDTGAEAPLHWTRDGAGWSRRRFATVEAVPGDEPVQHVCWHEASAFARWDGKRLPTEAEWEKAAAWDPATATSRPWPWGSAAPEAGSRANLGQRRLGPAPVGSYPDGVSALGCHQMVGDVWEWTSSRFEPYPGFRAFPYAEYSEVFWGDGYRVLRGGSWATDPTACRTTFRNWDLPIRRQIFAGFRCARDA
ncbi:MAG: ergothioneine biosynthesis protein EgtB [Acidimicrobiia bacterium]